MAKQNLNSVLAALVLLGLRLISAQESKTDGLLYPRESETREILSLDGMWNFVKSNPFNVTEGLLEEWFASDLRESVNVTKMPVPSSFNDLDIDDLTRDHTGTVWYDRTFFVTSSWENLRVWLRFGSVHYEANVWVNGEHVVQHTFGHLPFEVEVTDHLYYGKENRITVLCDNTLTLTTIPQGQISQPTGDNGVVSIQQYNFDFFNYAGIHRPVQLYTTPATYIKELNIDSFIDDDGHGHVNFEIVTNDNGMTNSAVVNIYDKETTLVTSQSVDGEMRGVAIINDVKKWWPYLMNSDPGYMYTMEVKLSTQSQDEIDVYRMKFGVRNIRWTSTEFLVNEKPVYFRGLGLHEDADVRKTFCR